MDLHTFILLVLESKLFWSIAITLIIANIIKLFVHYRKYKVWNPAVFLQTGGMPSSHTATTTALTIALAFETGPSPVFFLAALFAIITMRDSYGMRRSVSDQAFILNALASEMKMQEKVKIVLGHTPLQVFVGFTLGVVVTLCLYLF